jgi:hypothetical protein
MNDKLKKEILQTILIFENFSKDLKIFEEFIKEIK